MGSEYPKGGGRYSWGIRPSGGGGDIPRIFVPRWRYSTLFSSVSLAPCFEIGHRQSRLVDVLDLGMNLGWEEREKEKRDGTEIEEGVSEMTKYGVLVLQVTT